MLKKIFILLILIVFISVGCSKTENKNNLYKSILKRDKIIVGISLDSKPFGFIDSDGQVQGLEADLAREIAQEILGDRNKVVFKSITPQNRVNAAISGDVDMVISTMTINNQRKKSVDFSIPYFTTGQVICVRKGSKIDSPDDLMNKKVIVILGTTGEKNIQRLIPNVLVEGYTDNSEAIKAFKSGSGDAITTDGALLQGFIMENNDYILLPKTLTKEPYGIAFKKSRWTNSLKAGVDKIINEMKNNGTLESIKNKWIEN